jgi:DNA polymerase
MDEMLRLIRQIRQRMDSELAFGVTEFWVEPSASRTGSEGKVQKQDKTQTGIKHAGRSDTVTANRREEETDPAGRQLAVLCKQAILCKECELYRTRTKLVFGTGNPNARLMFVGEAPGMDEDLQGKPFVGKAGQLLTRIIEAMGLKREDVYIGNVLKCRPPENRLPLPSEIFACRHFIFDQIDIIKPVVSCALGKYAGQVLTGSDKPVTSLRGKWSEFRGIKVMPTFHPAYLLRNPSGKALVWEDMKKIMEELKLPAHPSLSSEGRGSM